MEVQCHAAFGVVVLQRHEGAGPEYLDADLLPQFPPQGGQGFLAGCDLAARELPAAGAVLAGLTPADQDAAVASAEDSRHHLQAGTGRLGHDSRPWHCLYFFPLPQGQGSLRPILRPSRTNGCTGSADAPPPPPPATASAAAAEAAAAPEASAEDWACWNSMAFLARCSASMRSTSSWLRSRTRIRMLMVSCFTCSSIWPNISKASRLYSCFGFF